MNTPKSIEEQIEEKEQEFQLELLALVRLADKRDDTGYGKAAAVMVRRYHAALTDIATSAREEGKAAAIKEACEVVDGHYAPINGNEDLKRRIRSISAPPQKGCCEKCANTHETYKGSRFIPCVCHCHKQ